MKTTKQQTGMMAVKRIISLMIAMGLWLTGQCSPESDSIESAPIRPVLSMFMLEIGGTSVLDTYLTPTRYEGSKLQIGYERMQSMRFNPTEWVMQMNVNAAYSIVENPAQNHDIHSLMAHFRWGMMHKWTIGNGVNMMAGGSTQVGGGVLYAPSNSNNVVSAKIKWSVNVTGMGSYNVKLWRVPITIRYQATLPIAGVFFSPEYGESYYEIYVGNRKGLVHFGWWGNTFDMENLLSADIHLGKTWVRVGYRNTIETSWVNNLNTQIYGNTMVLGVGGEWMSVNRRPSANEKARIISAMY